MELNSLIIPEGLFPLNLIPICARDFLRKISQGIIAAGFPPVSPDHNDQYGMLILRAMDSINSYSF